MRLTVIGLILVVFGVGSAAVNFWARQAFPDQWGGPNIGGGFLLLISAALTLVGLVLALIGLRRRAHRDR
jgi:uncharacterized membrane protein